MKLAFFAGSRGLQKQDNGKFGVTTFNNELWEKRYLTFADEIDFCSAAGDEKIGGNVHELNVKGVNAIECPDFATIKGQLQRNKAKKIIRGLVKKCDAAIIRLPGKPGEIAIKYCRKIGKPYLIELVGCPLDVYWNHSIEGKMVALPIFLSTKACVKNAPAVLYVTDHFLQERYPTNGISVGCSDVVLNRIDNDIINRRIDKIKGQSGKMVVGTIGAVDVKYKGQQYVIEALGILKKQGIINIEYQVVGAGNQAFLINTAKNCGVSDQVRMMGGLPHDEVFKWLDSIDVYIHPSRTEGMPRALIEALSRGVPAMGTRAGGITELLYDEVLFSKRRSVKEIVKILKSLDKNTMISFAKRNFDKAKDFETFILQEKRQHFYKEFFGSI